MKARRFLSATDGGCWFALLLGMAWASLCWIQSAHAQAVPAPVRNLQAVELRVPGQPAQRLYGESHALVIGASNYRAGWSRLPGVAQDARAVSELLRQLGFQVTVVNDPTRDQLDAALRSFAAGPGQRADNRLLVYFAGHGYTLTTNAGSRLGYIVPVDAPRPDTNPGGFRLLGYSMENVEVIARQMEARHVLFLFDSCFSGTIFRSRSGVPDSISDKTSRPVRQFITAGDADQQVPDESIFRRQLEAALREGAADLNHDGYVTGTELGVFLEDTVTNYTRKSQTPRWGKIRDPDLDKGDFVFALQPSTEAAMPLSEPNTPALPSTGARLANGVPDPDAEMRAAFNTTAASVDGAGAQSIAWRQFVQRWRTGVTTPGGLRLLQEASDNLQKAQATSDRYGPQCPVLQYPTAARRAEATGSTKVELRNGSDGHPQEIRIVKSSGTSREHSLLDQAAVDWLRQCIKSKPADVGKLQVFDMQWSLQ